MKNNNKNKRNNKNKNNKIWILIQTLIQMIYNYRIMIINKKIIKIKILNKNNIKNNKNKNNKQMKIIQKTYQQILMIN